MCVVFCVWFSLSDPVCIFCWSANSFRASLSLFRWNCEFNLPEEFIIRLFLTFGSVCGAVVAAQAKGNNKKKQVHIRTRVSISRKKIASNLCFLYRKQYRPIAVTSFTEFILFDKQKHHFFSWKHNSRPFIYWMRSRPFDMRTFSSIYSQLLDIFWVKSVEFVTKDNTIGKYTNIKRIN